MDLENLTYPSGHSKPSKSQIDVYETWIWYNSEVCNNCYAKVRDIGEEIVVETPLHTHKKNTYYERTENGVQAHTAFELAADRFGQTFCKQCGSDLGSLGYTKSKGEIARNAYNIINYINHPSNGVPYTIEDGRIVAQTIKDLKSVEENTGYSGEILAVGTINGIFQGKT